MKILYFSKAFEKKPTPKDAEDLYSKATPKFIHTVKSLADIIQIYKKGYTFRLPIDETKTQFIVLDIDDCLDGTMGAIQDYISKNKLTDTWYCDYSASMIATKCKVFVWLDSEIEVTKETLRFETERIIEILKKEVNDYCKDLTCDEHQFRSTGQLTYGLPQKESGIGGQAFEDDIPYVWVSNRTKKRIEQSRIRSLLNEFKYDKDKVNKDKYIDIPINKWEFNNFLREWRPDLFNDDKGYVNQLHSTYNTYYRNEEGKCCLKNFTDGHRHWAADEITKVIAMNTVILKIYYKVDVTVNNAMKALSKWIKYSFEKKDGEYWLEKEGYFKKYHDKLMKEIEDILNDCDWKEYSKDSDLKDYIATHHNSIPELIQSYKPRDKDLLEARKAFRETTLPYYKDELFTYDHDQIVELVENYYGRTKRYIQDSLIDLTIKEAKKDSRSKFFNRRIDLGRKHTITKERSDKGKTHNLTKERSKGIKHKEHKNKGKLTQVKGYEVIEGTVIIPRDKVTNSIRAYCSKYKIRIIRV